MNTNLNPKVSGYSLNNLFNRVLLPDPDGPQMTSGRGPPCDLPPIADLEYAGFCIVERKMEKIEFTKEFFK